MLETVFLAVLVLALLLGNAFLSITSPKKFGLSEGEILKQDALTRQAMAQPLVFEQGANGQPLLIAPQAAGQTTPSEVSFEEGAQGERIDYLNRRIARLEQLLLKLDGSKSIAQKINGTSLNQKLNELDDFKQNTRLEIAALKQRLDKVLPVERKPKGNVPEISDEKLRDLVFRASH